MNGVRVGGVVTGRVGVGRFVLEVGAGIPTSSPSITAPGASIERKRL